MLNKLLKKFNISHDKKKIIHDIYGQPKDNIILNGERLNISLCN